jgi:glycosyltransferase involved in cell wall biosynthesis
MKIGWIEISVKQYGGDTYNANARTALAQEFEVELVSCQARLFTWFRPLKLIESFVRLFALRGRRDVWVRDFYSTLTLPFDRTKGKQVVMIHHIDFAGFAWWARVLFGVTSRLFYRNLRKADAIVTVSDYWKNHFVSLGYSNVHIIPNGFDLEQFAISKEAVAEFRKKYHLEGKPIVYLGNCQKVKGAVESWEALKGLDAHFVTSGKRLVKIPARNLELSYRDYLTLLQASSVVLAMSNFQEGWGRTAHEAMLLKTPVIGSGSGGMRELLEGGGQIVVEDMRKLRKEVELLLEEPQRRAELGEMGYNFARTFSQERFEKAWIDIIRRIV